MKVDNRKHLSSDQFLVFVRLLSWFLCVLKKVIRLSLTELYLNSCEFFDCFIIVLFPVSIKYIFNFSLLVIDVFFFLVFRASKMRWFSAKFSVC